MQSSSDRKRNELITAWQMASELLGFRIMSPYTISHGKELIKCIAFLPDFGSKNGMIVDLIVPPNFEPTPGLIEAAKEVNMFYSSINWEIYRKFEMSLFKETLLEWGFWGDENLKPIWMTY